MNHYASDPRISRSGATDVLLTEGRLSVTHVLTCIHGHGSWLACSYKSTHTSILVFIELDDNELAN